MPPSSKGIIRATFPRHRIATPWSPNASMGSWITHSMSVPICHSAGATKNRPPLLTSWVLTPSSDSAAALWLFRGFTLQGRLTAYRRKRLCSADVTKLFPSKGELVHPANGQTLPGLHSFQAVTRVDKSLPMCRYKSTLDRCLLAVLNPSYFLSGTFVYGSFRFHLSAIY